jgi:uncharacterized protein
MLILIHSSKTMRQTYHNKFELSEPEFLSEAQELNDYLKSLDISELIQKMKISKELALKTKFIIDNWSTDKTKLSPSIESFIGDIYSGLSFQTWSQEDILYSKTNLRIISGLYGILRPLDGIYPYRLEMAYKLTPKPYKNLYDFWSSKLADSVSSSKIILNMLSEEYSKAIIPNLKTQQIISPVFKTYSGPKKDYVNVAVHSKIARGNLTAWTIKNKINNPQDLKHYDGLGYFYDSEKSTLLRPIFKTNNFKGLGLSIRKNN